MNSLGDFLIWSIEVFFLFLAIWVFIAIFSDIFRRTDIHGGAKAGWIFLIFILPFLGCLIYIIARPKVTPGDVQMMAQSRRGQPGRGQCVHGGRAGQAPAAQGCRDDQPGRVRPAQGEDARRS